MVIVSMSGAIDAFDSDDFGSEAGLWHLTSNDHRNPPSGPISHGEDRIQGEAMRRLPLISLGVCD
jgi:hypothetical protein